MFNFLEKHKAKQKLKIIEMHYKLHTSVVEKEVENDSRELELKSKLYTKLRESVKYLQEKGDVEKAFNLEIQMLELEAQICLIEESLVASKATMRTVLLSEIKTNYFANFQNNKSLWPVVESYVQENKNKVKKIVTSVTLEVKNQKQSYR